MTPKEKAKEICGKVDTILCGDISKSNVKYMACFIVDEILEATKKRKPKINPNTIDFYWEYSGYWLDVKQEIEKL